MNENYDHKGIESFAQKTWEEKNSFYASDDSKNQSIIVFRCFPIPQANYIWGM